jgi:hypothetical protein
MIRKLLIVFASGLALSILLLGAAWVVGGASLARMIQDGRGEWAWSGDHHGNGPRIVRTLDFDGDHILRIDAPVTLRFTRGDTTRMTVEGPRRTLDRLQYQDGRLSLHGRSWSHGAIKVDITAPRIAGLEINGASDVELNGLDQPNLTIDARGAVDLDASGKVQTLTVSSHGAGDLDLEKLDARDATVRIAGVGDVDISASGTVDAAISGAGDISLHRKPARLTSTINGVGSIDHHY